MVVIRQGLDQMIDMLRRNSLAAHSKTSSALASPSLRNPRTCTDCPLRGRKHRYSHVPLALRHYGYGKSKL